jgi:translation elongation factor EF-4
MVEISPERKKLLEKQKKERKECVRLVMWKSHKKPFMSVLKLNDD